MTEHNSLSPLLISLFKGVLYREDNQTQWQELVRHQGRIQDYVSLLGLQVVVDEQAGYGFLQNREDDQETENLPRLIPRRRLSYPVSLTLVLLRRRLADHDSSTGEDRLILSTDEVVEMLRTFLPEGNTESRTIDRMSSILSKIADLGFIRFIDPAKTKLEIKRILSAFVDAQWMNQFDERLREYADHALDREEE